MQVRWLSVLKPLERIYNEFPALLAFIAAQCAKRKPRTWATELYPKLTSLETLLGIATLLPLLNLLQVKQ
jgi:hypothetical protein